MATRGTTAAKGKGKSKSKTKTKTKTPPVSRVEMALRETQEYALQRRADAHQTVRTMSVNDEWRQGDVYVRYLGEKVPAKCKPNPTPRAKLVPGESMGSQHCLSAESFPKVRQFVWPGDDPCVGPVLLAPEGFTLEHVPPAQGGHGAVTFEQPGCYAIIYQRAFAEERRAVQD